MRIGFKLEMREVHFKYLIDVFVVYLIQPAKFESWIQPFLHEFGSERDYFRCI